MPTTFVEDWKKAKEAFTKATGSKKPSASFLSVFNKGPGISAALKKADAAKNAAELYSGLKEFKKSYDEYAKTLDKAIIDPKVTDPTAKQTYVTATNKLKKDLKDIYDSMYLVGENLNNAKGKDGVYTAAYKGEAEAKLKQTIAPLEEVWSKDFADEVHGHLPWLDMKGYVVELKVNSDILDLMHKTDGGATQSLMQHDAQTLCEKYAKKYIEEVEKLQGKGDGSMKEVTRQATELFKQLHPHLVEEVGKIPKIRFDKFRNDRPMYREFQIKTGVSITTGVLQIVGGAVALAGAVPSHGASLGLAVVALARGLNNTTTQIVTIVRSVESLQKDLVSTVGQLEKVYLDTKKKATARMKIQEIGASALSALLGADAPFVASLPKCDRLYGTWKAKVAGLRIGFGKAVKGANDLLAKLDELEAEVEKSKSPKVAKIVEKIEKIRAKVMETLGAAQKLGGRIVKAEAVEVNLEEMFAALHEANPDYVRIFTILAPAAVNVGLAAGGAGIDFSGGVAGLELGNTILGLITELLSNLKEMAEKAME